MTQSKGSINPGSKTVSTKEAAAIVGCTPQHIRTLVSQGKLRSEKIPSTRNPFKYEIQVDKKDAQRYAKTVPKKGWQRGVKRVSRSSK